jgi:hypothetical protein
MFACRLGQKAALNARLDEPEAVPRENYERYADKNGSPGVIRTPDQRFRKPLLCPSELRGHVAGSQELSSTPWKLR